MWTVWLAIGWSVADSISNVCFLVPSIYKVSMRNVEYTERLYMILFISFKIHDKQTLKQPNVYICERLQSKEVTMFAWSHGIACSVAKVKL